MEDSKQTMDELIYTIDQATCGLDSALRTSGWKVDGFDVEVSVHTYPWGEDYSQLVFTIGMVREMGTTVIKTFLPPLIFCIVAGLAFFFKADKITHRLGLGTSMLISSVMFHLSQTSSLPALPSLILMDKVMIAVYVFISCSLLSTTIIYIDDEFWKDVDYTDIVNRAGLVVSMVLPIVVFIALFLI